MPSQYVYECLEEHFVDILRKAVRTAIGPNAKLEYSVVVEESHPRDPLSVTMPSNNMKDVYKRQDVSCAGWQRLYIPV